MNNFIMQLRLLNVGCHVGSVFLGFLLYVCLDCNVLDKYSDVATQLDL